MPEPRPSFGEWVDRLEKARDREIDTLRERLDRIENRLVTVLILFLVQVLGVVGKILYDYLSKGVK